MAITAAVPPHRMSECVVHDVRAAEPVCFVGGCVMVPMVEAVKQRQIAARLTRRA